MPTLTPVERAASAIANARGGRRGAPPIVNILELLGRNGTGKLRDEVLEDARAVFEAIGFEELLAALREADAGLQLASGVACNCTPNAGPAPGQAAGFVCSCCKARAAVLAAIARVENPAP
jgi:hypothetical protein